MAVAVTKKTMAEMTVAEMTMTKPAVASAMPAVTSSESLTRDGQRGGAQRQRSDRGGSDHLEFRHGRLLGWAERETPCDGSTPRGAGCGAM